MPAVPGWAHGRRRLGGAVRLVRIIKIMGAAGERIHCRYCLEAYCGDIGEILTDAAQSNFAARRSVGFTISRETVRIEALAHIVVARKWSGLLL